MRSKPKNRTEIYQYYPSKENIRVIEMLSPMLDSSIDEMRELSKKKPDDSLNITKINILNRLIKSLKEAMSIDPSNVYLDLLDTDHLPSNSDAVLILVQYKAALSQFHNKYYGWDGSQHRWFTSEDPG
jgi:hypothetical protein